MCFDRWTRHLPGAADPLPVRSGPPGAGTDRQRRDRGGLSARTAEIRSGPTFHAGTPARNTSGASRDTATRASGGSGAAATGIPGRHVGADAAGAGCACCCYRAHTAATAAAQTHRQKTSKARPTPQRTTAAQPGIPPSSACTADAGYPAADRLGRNTGACAGALTRGERWLSRSVERLAGKPQALSRHRPSARGRGKCGASLRGRP